MFDKRILIVDNDYGMADSLRDILELEGHEVTLADGGEQALEMLETNNFDCFLLDMKMPGISGFDVFRILKENLESPYVVFLTGFSEEHLIKQAHEEGAAAVLTKPVDLKRLIALVRSSGAGNGEETSDANTPM